MACRLVGAKPLSEHMMDIVNWFLNNELQRNFNRNPYIFIQENAFENVVWKRRPFFIRAQCVKQELVWSMILSEATRTGINVMSFCFYILIPWFNLTTIPNLFLLPLGIRRPRTTFTRYSRNICLIFVFNYSNVSLGCGMKFLTHDITFCIVLCKASLPMAL